MGFYENVRATAGRLLAADKFGRGMTLRRTTMAYNPATQTSTPTVADYAASGVVAEYEDKDIDGTLVKAGDRLIILSAEGLAITPTPADKVIVGGVVYSIVRDKPTNPAGVAVVYELQVRK